MPAKIRAKLDRRPLPLVLTIINNKSNRESTISNLIIINRNSDQDCHSDKGANFRSQLTKISFEADVNLGLPLPAQT